jgi:hypothetical protein
MGRLVHVGQGQYASDIMNEDAKAILYNILGGIIVSALTALYVYLRNKLNRYHLQRLLGYQLRDHTQVRIVYGQLTLPPLQNSTGQVITHPYVKAPRRGGALPLQGTYSITYPVSECEVRASTYLTSMLSSPGNLRPLVVSDIEVDALLDSNLITLGGPGSNFKTADILASPANLFIQMTHAGLSTVSGESLPFGCNQTNDHGFILRITPPQFPQRSWIACVGLGEWGTSGSAWFLANKWRQLLSAIHPLAYLSGVASIPDFVAIVRVIPGQDQSADIAALYRKSGNVIKKVK